MEKVSVIIPVYNAENDIRACIDSVLRQTYKNFEIIAVNDGSTDGSLEILLDLESKDPRIRIISKKNEGVSKARNCGIDAARGQYIVFLDSDDSYKNTYLERMVRRMEADTTDLVICGYTIKQKSEDVFEQTQRGIEISRLEDKYITIRENGLLNAPWNKLFKRSLIDTKRFPNEISLGEDLLFVYSYLSVCKKITILSDCLYEYSWPSDYNLTKKYHSNGLLAAKKVYENDVIFSNKYFTKSYYEKILEWFTNAYVSCCMSLVLRSGLGIGMMHSIFKNWQGEDLVQEICKKRCLKKYGRIGNLLQSKKFIFVYVYLFFKQKLT